MRYLQVIIYGILFSVLPFVCAADEFPYRKDFSHVPVVELEDLKAGFDRGEFVLVDVRSGLEFDTIHPKKAVHIPMANARFEEQVLLLAEQYPGKKIAVYCNGVTCLKSYKAAERGIAAGIFNVYSFDAGIPAWAEAYPSETLLLGKEIENPAMQLIEKSEFKKRCLDYEQFKEGSTRSNAVVVDARDAIQRTEDLPGLNNVKQIPLDKFFKNVVNRGVMKKKSLYIFDQVGKQVRWLMYHLVNQGYTQFYFLNGGATSVLQKQEYRQSSLRSVNKIQNGSAGEFSKDGHKSLAINERHPSSPVR